jgi:hypothetical protein
MAPKTFLHPELINLAPKLGEDKLKELASIVIEEFDRDVDDLSGWDAKHKKWAEIYYQEDDTSDPQKTWGSTQSIPLLTEACNQFAARTRKAFFPNKDFVSTSLSSLGVFDTAQDDEAILAEASQRMKGYRISVERVRKHMNYQLTVQNTHYKQQKDALFLSLPVHGSVFSKAYWDVESRQPRVDTVRAADLIVPYNAGPVRIEDVDRKTHKLFWSQLKTQQLADIGFFVSAAEPSNNIQKYMSGPTEASNEADGVTPRNSADDDDHSSLCFILEQHRFWEIDKLVVPVIVWVDYESQKVLRVAIRYETDDRGTPINNRQPVEYFTHYKFLENPDGFYGYGYGHMLGSMNTAINKALRSSLDAAFLATEGNNGGFISQRLVPQDDAGTEMEVSIGKYTVVPDAVADISNGIVQNKFPGPTEALVTLMDKLDYRGQRLGSVTEASTGQVDKIRQSNALMTELEQALELPSNIHMRLVDSMTDELGKIYRLNRVNLEEKVVFVIKDEPSIVSRADYELNAIVTPTFDPKMSTMAQKIARAQTELDAVLKNPMTAQDPNVLKNAFTRFFEAIESEDIDELLPQSAPAPEPMRIDDQRAENMLFLMPPGEAPMFDVFADQDHAQHLALIDDFVASPYGQEIDPAAAEGLKNHRQKHLSYLYGEESGLNGIGGQTAAAPADNVMGPTGLDQGGAPPSPTPLPANGAMGPGADMGAAA